jgi:hypothetical protein
MGTNFTAIFGHSFNDYHEILSFKTMLEKNNDIRFLFKNLSESSFPSEIQWEWIPFDWINPESQYINEGYVGIEASDYGRLLIGKNICELTLFLGWSFFLKDKKIRMKTRRICRNLSLKLGNPIYLPEHYDYVNFIYEGGTINSVLSSLKKRFGEPCQEIELMYIEHENYWETEGYYIDSFEDFEQCCF